MKDIVFFNTLSGKKETFRSLTPGKVGLYTCGPTVYDYAHIGNFRAYLFEDLLRRFLEHRGYEVDQIMNITDVDDKTIAGAVKQKVTLGQFTEKFIQAFYEDLNSLRIEKCREYPRATEHIPEMLSLIESLIQKGHAYQTGGSVYFKIQSFPKYGALSKKKLEANIQGARVDHDEYEKEDLSDFVLWKETKPGEPFWESPYGQGRPGWHIECSAMSMKFLKHHFDIHTGGEDNVFPHHENEIAQSECATGSKFVNYWLHCRFLLVDGEKMSKSKGNFYTLRDLLQKGQDPVSIRYLLLSHHYRHPLNFTLEGVEQAHKAVDRINAFFRRMESVAPSPSVKETSELLESLQQSYDDFDAALADDLNISEALGIFFDFMKVANRHADENTLGPKAMQIITRWIAMFDKILDVRKKADNAIPENVRQLVAAREEARRQKQFQESDRLRDLLLAQGWAVKDTKEGMKVERL